MAAHGECFALKRRFFISISMLLALLLGGCSRNMGSHIQLPETATEVSAGHSEEQAARVPTPEEIAAYYKENKSALEYQRACDALEEGDLEKALQGFTALGAYSDSADRVLEILDIYYDNACALMDCNKFSDAAALFAKTEGHRDSDHLRLQCWYNLGEQEQTAENYGAAAIAFGKAGDFDDARARSRALWNQVAQRQTIAASYPTHALTEDGACYDWEDGPKRSEFLNDIIAIAGQYGLSEDGTICSIYDGIILDLGNDFVSISEHYGLLTDGTVKRLGLVNDLKEYTDEDGWHDLIAITDIAALRSDGTVVNASGQMLGWHDITAIASGVHDGYLPTPLIVGLDCEGHVFVTNKKHLDGWDVTDDGQILDLENITAIAAGESHIACLREDGTVVAIGDNTYGQCEVDQRTDIVDICANRVRTLGLRSDGTLVAAGPDLSKIEDDEEKRTLHRWNPDVSAWKNIRLPDHLLTSAP